VQLKTVDKHSKEIERTIIQYSTTIEEVIHKNIHNIKKCSSG